MSSTLYTTPIPPPPSISSTRYWETFFLIRFALADVWTVAPSYLQLYGFFFEQEPRT